MDWRLNNTITPFQRVIYEICSAIPKGKVTTYGGISNILSLYINKEQSKSSSTSSTTTLSSTSSSSISSLKISSQAIGTALKLNPFAPIVPCHRILKAGNPPTIGGFSGITEEIGTRIGNNAVKNTPSENYHPNIQKKLRLLKEEGVNFNVDTLELLDTTKLMRTHEWNTKDMEKAAQLYLLSRQNLSKHTMNKNDTAITTMKTISKKRTIKDTNVPNEEMIGSKKKKKN